MTQETWGSIVDKAREEGGFELIPPSTYDWQIVGSDPGTTSTGKSRIRVKAVILSGPLAGKSAWKDLVFDSDPGVMSIRVQELEALGIDPSQYQGTIEQVVNQLAPALVNTTFKAQLTHRQWAGQMRNNLGIFQKRAAGGAPTPGVAAPAPTQSGTPTAPAPVTAPAAPQVPSAEPPPAPEGEAPF